MSADSLAATPRIGGRLSDIQLYGGLFAGAVGAFCLAQWMGRRLGLASDIVAIAGDATCGWSWLLVRALFQPATTRRTTWPLALVLTLVASGAFLRLAGDSAATLPRMVENLSGLISSALLLLAMIEPLTGLASASSKSERRFRLAFAAGYAALLAIAVVWVNGAPAGGVAGHGRMAIKSACALLALLGMALAIWYRHGRPLTQASRLRPRAQAVEPRDLADRLRRLMSEDAVYTRSSLKVADLARRLGEPDYKVTQCITGPLGFRNFNQMANYFRIEEAKRRLADPTYGHLPILTIAYDCGFGSVGPFNRAFKATMGVTPQQFRRAN